MSTRRGKDKSTALKETCRRKRDGALQEREAFRWARELDEHLSTQGKIDIFFVNSHTNATRIGWHVWEIDLIFAPGLPPGWGAMCGVRICRLVSLRGVGIWGTRSCKRAGICGA